MLSYTKSAKWIKKAALLGGEAIRFDTLCCSTVLPAVPDLGDLVANEIFEIDIVTEGSGICRVFGQSIPCGKGDMFIIRGDIPHNCFVQDSAERVHLLRIFLDIHDWFSGEVTDSRSPRFCYGAFCEGSVIAYASLNAETYDRVLDLVAAVSQEISSARPEWKSAVSAHLTMLLLTFARYVGEAEHVHTEANKEWHHAGAAVRMVLENFGDSTLKLETLAAALLISKSHFSRLFRAFTGENFSEYLRKVRLGHACKLLRNTEKTVEQIADECGMKDVQTFYRSFRSYVGSTPHRYRVAKNRTEPEKMQGLLDDIAEKIQSGKSKAIAELVHRAADEGCDPERILNEGLLRGMDIISEKFRTGEIFVSEVLISARTMHLGAQALKPYLAATGAATVGRVCLGTVHGDLHDIGKNLVKMMMEGKGIEVVDLGTDVPAEVFIKTAIEQDCDVICCSALLTTTMPVLERVVRVAEEAGIRDRVRIMVGGAPVTEEYCRQIGADAYTADAAAAADVAAAFCTERRNNRKGESI